MSQNVIKSLATLHSVRRHFLNGTLLCLTVLGAVDCAYGAKTTWSGGTGNWADSINWSNDVPGVAFDSEDLSIRANVYTGTTQISSFVLDVDQLVLHGPGKVELNSGGEIWVGSGLNQTSGGSGASEFEINGGILNVGMDTRWRVGNDAEGNFTINSGSVLFGGATKDINVGVGTGTGILNINGGLWDLDGTDERNMVIGDSDNAFGTLNFRGGDFRERDVRHDKGNATVNIYGSDHTQIKVRQFNFESDLANKNSSVNFFLDAGGITAVEAHATVRLSDTTISVDFDSGYDGTGITVGDTFDLINTTSSFEDALGNNAGDFKVESIVPGFDFTSEIFIDTNLDEILRITITEIGSSVMTGDFDGDGDIDGSDFLAWQAGFGISSGALLSEGDANGDGQVNAADFTIWQNQYGTTTGLGSLASGSVPEPTSLGLALIAFIAGIASIRCRRSSR